MPSDYDIHLVRAPTHGRVLVRRSSGTPRGVLVGFHGYMESAETQMQRLEAIPAASDWALVSVHGLHRVSRGRTTDVVASWMTRQDRDAAIADNIEYVDAALDVVPHDGSTRLVYAGFSQGAAMAFRSAVRGRHPAAGVIAVGADVPPELLLDPSATFPAVWLARGQRDEWLTPEQFRRDLNALAARSGRVRAYEYDGGHEWNDAVTEMAGEFLLSV
jgi:predicted esterase